MPAEPREAAPDQRRAEDTEQPACSGNDPQEQASPRRFAIFLSAKANAHLRARHQIARHGNRDAAKSMQSVLRGGSFAGTIGALAQVLRQPGLIGCGDAFHEGFRQESLGTLVKGFVHAAPSCRADFSAARPRYSRDFTVEMGVASTAAISSRPSSS